MGPVPRRAASVTRERGRLARAAADDPGPHPRLGGRGDRRRSREALFRNRARSASAFSSTRQMKRRSGWRCSSSGPARHAIQRSRTIELDPGAGETERPVHHQRYANDHNRRQPGEAVYWPAPAETRVCDRNPAPQCCAKCVLRRRGEGRRGPVRGGPYGAEERKHQLRHEEEQV